MATLIFDTHVFVKQLTEAGMPEPQAEVLARTQAALIDERLATKEDLQALELRLKHQNGESGVRLSKQIKESGDRLVQQMIEMESRLKNDLTVRFGFMLVVTTGVIILWELMQ